MDVNKHDFDYYRNLFKDYPDLLTVRQLCKMLKFRSQTSIMRRIQQKCIPYYRNGRQYMIPKEWAIQYILSKDFEAHRSQLFLSDKSGT